MLPAAGNGPGEQCAAEPPSLTAPVRPLRAPAFIPSRWLPKGRFGMRKESRAQVTHTRTQKTENYRTLVTLRVAAKQCATLWQPTFMARIECVRRALPGRECAVHFHGASGPNKSTFSSSPPRQTAHSLTACPVLF